MTPKFKINESVFYVLKESPEYLKSTIQEITIHYFGMNYKLNNCMGNDMKAEEKYIHKTLEEAKTFAIIQEVERHKLFLEKIDNKS